MYNTTEIKLYWALLNLFMVPEYFPTVAQLSNEMLNISCAKSVVGTHEILLGHQIYYFKLVAIANTLSFVLVEHAIKTCKYNIIVTDAPSIRLTFPS